MKIGIGTFNLENLMKAGLEEEGIQEAFDPIISIRDSIEMGIKHFEITYDVNMMMGEMDLDKKVEEMLELKEKYGLSYSVHLPFRGVDISYPDMGIGQAYAAMMAKIITSLEPLGPESYVLHATGGVAAKVGKLPPNSYTVQLMVKQSENVIKSIIDKSGVNPRKLAIENIKFPFIALEQMIYENDLSVCMDAGHLTAGYSGDFTLKNFLNRYYDRIIEIHLHDAYRKSTQDGVEVKDHMQLGKGDIDWMWLFDDLKEKGYDKRIILEMKFSDALLSIKNVKAVFPEL